MTAKTSWLTMAVLASVVLPAVAWAEVSGPTVSGNGTAKLEKMPELIRLKVEIQAAAPTVKEALAKLNSKRESALGKLKELGADEKTVKVDGPRITPDPMEAARRRMAMMGEGADAAEESEEEAAPAKVNVALSLEAEWPLKAESSEALLVFGYELKEKIKKADLAGLKEEKLTPEEEEEQAEMRNRMRRFDFDPERIPAGEPIIIYVAKVSDAERNKLLGEAFGKAKAEATELAAVAGLQVGRLQNINSHFAGQEDDMRFQYAYGSNPQMYQIMQQARAMSSPDDRQNEAIGVDPSMLTYRLMVMAVYELK